MTKDEKEILIEIKEDIARIKTCLRGYTDGENGLIAQVENNKQKLNNLSNKIWFITGVAAAGGGSIGSLLAKLLGG